MGWFLTPAGDLPLPVLPDLGMLTLSLDMALNWLAPTKVWAFLQFSPRGHSLL